MGGRGSRGHHVPFGGTTIPLFEKDCTLRQGRQKCHVHRHQEADGLSNTTTPAILPRPRHADGCGVDGEDGEGEVERLEKLLKKHEMGEIPRIDWLDQLTFRAIEQQSLLTPHPPKKAFTEKRVGKDPEDGSVTDDKGVQRNGEAPDPKNVQESSVEDSDGMFVLFIDFPRFDFPIVFTDHEYAPPPISSHPNYTPSSSHVTLRPPPGVQGGPASGTLNPDDDPYGGRIVKIYDPEVFARDNPAESMHRRLVRSHRTSLLDRDLKPNAKIRDELNVSSLHNGSLKRTRHLPASH